MPYYELLILINQRRETIVSTQEERIITDGHTYFRSVEGLEYNGQAWYPKYRWFTL